MSGKKQLKGLEKRRKKWLRNKCLDCGKLISKVSKRCHRCAQVGRKFTIDHRKKLSENAQKRKFSSRTRLKMSLARRGSKHPNWKDGSTMLGYPPTFNQQLKDRIRVRDNFICQICGVPELECDIRLDVHHIDYNKDNSNMDNLVSLCHSCHMKTNYKRNEWKEYFSGRTQLTYK